MTRALSAALLLIWAAFFISLDFYPDIPPRNDDSYYLTLAKSLSLGRGYDNLSFPDTRQSLDCFPSGFPLFLMAYWWFIAPHVLFLKLILAGSLIAGVAGSYRWMRRFLPTMEAGIAAAAFSSAPMFIMLGNSILSETIFIPVLYAGLILTLKVNENPDDNRNKWYALACMVILARIREVGLAFFALTIISVLLRREWRKAAVAVVVVAVWMLWENLSVHANTGSLNYVSDMATEYGFINDPLKALLILGHQYIHNLWSFVGSIYANILFPWFYNFAEMNRIKRLVVLGVFLEGSAGAVLLWKKHGEFRPAIAALLLSWIPVFGMPYTGSLFRHLFPFFPFLVLFFIYPLHCLAERIKFPAARYGVLLLLIAIVANQAIWSLQENSFDPFIAQRIEFAEIHDYIREAGKKPDLLVSPQNFYSYLKTGIPSCFVRENGDLCRYEKYFSGRNVWGIFDTTRFSLKKNNRCDSLELKPSGEALIARGKWRLCRMEKVKYPLDDRLR